MLSVLAANLGLSLFTCYLYYKKRTQTKNVWKEKMITVLFRFPVSFQHLAEVMTHHWADVPVGPLHPVQASSAKEVKTSPGNLKPRPP